MQQGTARSGYHGVVLAAYLALALAAYWRALDAFFVSDDFEFLGAVAASPAWLAVHPDAARFFRPLVVLLYSACYRAFGLDPRAYHVAVLLLHVFNAWCVYLITRRLLPRAGGAAWITAGGLFLLFSSHSEAVAWPAGVADPALAALLLPAFLAYQRAVEPGASARWVAASVLLMLAGTLAKESWVVFPPIVVAHAVLLGERSPFARRRAAAIAGTGAAAVLGYLLARRLLFGSVTGGYAGLGSSVAAGAFVDTARAFVLRCVIPGDLRALDIWQRRLDLVAWAVLAALLALRAERRDARVALFAAAAVLVSLSPVLPLTISVVNTESERFTYLPTAFSCLLIVAAAAAILRRRALVVLACLPLLAWHGVVLRRNATRWHDAGEMARRIVDTFATTVRANEAEAPRPIFLLNLPDNLSGAYVFRRGFYPAVALFAPELGGVTDRTIGVATNAVGYQGDPVSVRRVGDRRFVVDFGTARIVQPRIPDSTWYRIVAQAPTRYEVEFTDAVRSGLVLFTSAGRIALAGSVSGPGAPFGTFELPDDGAACAGVSLRMSGWALGERGMGRVTLEAVEAGGGRPLGDARWVAGTRPGVAARFRWLPGADRAEWDYDLPCALLPATARGEVTVRATAVDSEGQRVELGTRLVKNAR